LYGAYDRFFEAMNLAPYSQREIINYVIIVIRILESGKKDGALIAK
jgi:hypothetical protein